MSLKSIVKMLSPSKVPSVQDLEKEIEARNKILENGSPEEFKQMMEKEAREEQKRRGWSVSDRMEYRKRYKRAENNVAMREVEVEISRNPKKYQRQFAKSWQKLEQEAAEEIRSDGKAFTDRMRRLMQDKGRS